MDGHTFTRLQAKGPFSVGPLKETWRRCFDVGKPCLIITKEEKQPHKITTPDVRERESGNTFEKKYRPEAKGGEEEENGKVTVKSQKFVTD